MAPDTYHFLVVDDDPVFRTVAEYVITSLGPHRVSSAGDGMAGLELLQASTHLVDVIILDLNMPRLDGLAFIRAAVEFGFTGQIVISSGESPAVRAAAERIGTMLGARIAGMFAKPITTQAVGGLLEALKAAQADVLDRPAHPAGDRKLTTLPHYQPQYNIDNGALEGFEALARATDAAGGVFGADIALGDMNNHARLVELTLAIHHQVLRDIAAWRAQGFGCHVSINLDAAMLEDSGFVAHLVDLTRGAGIAPSSLAYEMTERRMPEDLSRVIENTARLRMAGFGVALDDFGTGAANFDILKSCPFSEVKIDRSIIGACLADAQTREFIDFTVGMAREYGLRLIAEGTETFAEVDYVRRAGISVVQGYYFDKALPFRKASDRLREGFSPLIKTALSSPATFAANG